MHLTPIFGPDVKPVHVGVYRTKYCGDPWAYSLWDGRRWWLSAYTVARARNSVWPSVLCQGKQWRGLAEKPA